MGLISGIFTWPLTLPVRGLIRLAELIQEQVERETRNPATVRRKLEEIEAMRAAGEISEEDERQAIEQVLRMATRR
ncbi:gas vesicle protein GvpG [Nonomuraea fuscirosea]|uniref:Gas vesicle protein GvpG n=1 Tax=Nonomuraea fuscirosea TaxID=1291556 RepID=A0A2T0N703_9ACTN|nr:gas vesicle protein GvpG [Nonomuraea fuscirosea]PRX68261.1 gas vesicle protein GvpG [Nonomuraea fuscirosea]